MRNLIFNEETSYKSECMDADLMFFREFNRPHATMEVTVSYFWSGVAMVTLSVLNRKVVEENFLRNLANVYLRLMYM